MSDNFCVERTRGRGALAMRHRSAVIAEVSRPNGFSKSHNSFHPFFYGRPFFHVPHR